MWDVRVRDPIRVPVSKHRGSTLLAKTAEVRQDFFLNEILTTYNEHVGVLSEDWKSSEAAHGQDTRERGQV